MKKHLMNSLTLIKVETAVGLVYSLLTKKAFETINIKNSLKILKNDVVPELHMHVIIKVGS